ncbi:MAG: DUF6794 domain-containing protein [Bacteroidia bacterium]
MKTCILFALLISMQFAFAQKQTKPHNLEQCFAQLDEMLADSTKDKIMAGSEDDFVVNSHFGLGRWMRNNWGLWGNSKLRKFFKKMGLFHPDDMSSIILRSYYRYLKDEEIRLEEQVKFYQDYWGKRKKNEGK